jgi:hypothetical protein
MDQGESRSEALDAAAWRFLGGGGLDGGGDESTERSQLLYDVGVAVRSGGVFGSHRAARGGNPLDAKNFARLAHMAPT